MDKADKRRKLNNDQLKQLREERASGIPVWALAEIYEIDYSYVSVLCRGIARKEAGGPVGKLHLSEKVISIIRKKRSKKARIKDLAEEFGLTAKHISLICTGKVHKRKKGIITTQKDLLFSRKDVVSIRKRHDKGEKRKVLAEEYEVTYATIEGIVTGKSYKNYPGPIHKADKKLSQFKEADVIKMRKRHFKGESCNALAEEYGISGGSMNKILTGEKFSDFGGPVKEIIKRVKLKKRAVVSLRTRHGEGERCSDLAREFRMPYENMRKILKNKIYKNFPGPGRSGNQT